MDIIYTGKFQNNLLQMLVATKKVITDERRLNIITHKIVEQGYLHLVLHQEYGNEIFWEEKSYRPDYHISSLEEFLDKIEKEEKRIEDEKNQMVGKHKVSITKDVMSVGCQSLSWEKVEFLYNRMKALRESK